MNKSKIKAHLRRHKNAYILVGTSISVAGITYLVMRTRMPTASQSGPLAELPRSTKELSGSYFSAGNDMVNVGNVTHVNFGGYSHKLIRCNSTGEIWESVSEAAADLGVDRSTLSRHINGHVPHVHGETYSIIGVGTRTA